MKNIRNISYAALAYFAITFSACTQNEDVAPTLKGQEINVVFSVGGVQTRVNTLGAGNRWENGDQINVLQIYGDESTRTGKYQYIEENGQARWNSLKTIRWEREERCELIAWFPSDITNPLTYNLHTDQSDEDLLKKADLINGYWYDVPNNYVEIDMYHRMSMVSIIYHVGTADYPNKDISNPQVYSKHTRVSFERDLEQKQFVMSSPTGNPNWVNACLHDGNMFSAIVIPGSYVKDEVFLKFKIGDNNFNVKMKTPTEFKEGKRYTYKLDVGKDKVKLTQISVDDLKGWDSNNEEDLK